MQLKTSKRGKLITAALLTLAITLLLTPALANTLFRPSHVLADSEQSFHFAVLSGTPVGSSPATATKILVLSGAGTFSASEAKVRASGSYNIVNNTSPVPQTILDQGTWHAIGFISWNQIGTFGQITPGILKITVEFDSISGTQTTTTMTVVCNAPQGGFFTGSIEGVTATVGGTTFAPTSPNRGITLIELTAA
jgi:hypothetical protein